MDKTRDKRSVPLKRFEARRYHQCSIGGCRNLTKNLYSARLRDPYTQTPIYICDHCMYDMLSIYEAESEEFMKNNPITGFTKQAYIDESTNTDFNTIVNISDSTIERNQDESVGDVTVETVYTDDIEKPKRGRPKKS